MKKDLDSFDLGIDNDHVSIDDFLEAGRALTRISNTYKISLRTVFKQNSVSELQIPFIKTVKSQMKSEEASKFLENAEFMSMIQLFNENGFYHECSQWIYEILSNNPSQGSYCCVIEIGI